MRSTLLWSPVVLGLVAACDDYDMHDRYRHDGSSIVFGLQQQTDASGKTVTKAGYEYLELANKGGWSATVERVATGDVCIHEELRGRIGRPNVGDGGRARFAGGGLPSDGIVIDANGPLETTFDGKAFGANDGFLSFAVDFGFGLPNLGGDIPLGQPNEAVNVTTPADAVDMTVDATHDASFAWTTPSPSAEHARARVMVSFETDDEQDHGNQVRCFYDESDLAGVVPARFFAQLGPAGTKGTVTIASHRQSEAYARGGWLVYVVGTIVLREQRFAIQ